MIGLSVVELIEKWTGLREVEGADQKLDFFSPRIDPLEHPHPLEPSSIGRGEIRNPAIWKSFTEKWKSVPAFFAVK